MGAKYELRGDVAVITLDNPPVNGLGYDTRRECSAGLDRAIDDAAVRAVVVTGGGRAFSGGADIKEFGSPKALAEPNLHSLIRQIENSPKPVVAAINGTCMGGGLELALGMHYRLAAAGVDIALPEIKLGIIPGAGGTQRLPRAVGKSKAMDMVLTARMMDAAEAERAGLVSRVVPAERLLDEALAAAEAINALSPASVQLAKACVNKSFEGGLLDGVHFERRIFHSLFATEDQKEGMAAFVEKRKPAWRNR
ncbi:MAG: enoyl-CoA hydratase-related protein [Rubrivivax sp.]